MSASLAEATVDFEAAGGRDQVSGVLAALTDDVLLVEQREEGVSGVAVLIPAPAWCACEPSTRRAIRTAEAIWRLFGYYTEVP